MTDHPTPTASVDDVLLARAARRLQRLMRVTDDQVAVQDIAFSIKQSVVDAHAANPLDLCDMLVTQSRVLDGAFGWFIDRAATHPEAAELSLSMALKAQQQTIRTLQTWKDIKDDSRINDIREDFLARERGLLQ